jgi:hypothetical protein
MYKSLPTWVKRALLNLKSNRWWVLVGPRLFLHSPRHKYFLSQKWEPAAAKLADPSIRVYVRLTKWSLPPSSVSLLHSGFLISHLGRFGNATREIVGAYALAHSLSLGNVVMIGPNGFRKGGPLAHPGIHDSKNAISVWIGATTFRKVPPLDMLVSWKRGSFPVAPGAGDIAWGAAPGFLGLAGEQQSLGSKTLVIHLRGGDVFGGREAPEYGQPPLGFYVKVLTHRVWDRVIIVHEDDRNPVLQGLLDYCRSKGISARTVSGTLRDDLAVLLSAEHLVASRGTFGPAIVGLSRRAKNVYYFEDKFAIYPPKSGVTLFRAEDRTGEYRDKILRSNWQHSRSQLALMLSYDSEKIRIEDGQNT